MFIWNLCRIMLTSRGYFSIKALSAAPTAQACEWGGCLATINNQHLTAPQINRTLQSHRCPHYSWKGTCLHRFGLLSERTIHNTLYTLPGLQQSVPLSLLSLVWWSWCCLWPQWSLLAPGRKGYGPVRGGRGMLAGWRRWWWWWLGWAWVMVVMVSNILWRWVGGVR